VGFKVLWSEEWISFDNSDKTKTSYEINQSDNIAVDLDITIPGMNSEIVSGYNRVNILEQVSMDSVGCPEVPIVTYLIAIPDCNGVDLEITAIDSTIISNVNIYPKPELVEVTNNEYTYLEEQFTIDNTVYNTNSFYPNYKAEIVNKGAVRSQHCIRLKIYPVQFNPVTQQIIAYSKFNVKLSFTGVSGLINENVGIFNGVVCNSMINVVDTGLNASINTNSDTPGNITYLNNSSSIQNLLAGNISCDYLVITHEDIRLNADIALQNLMNHRANFNGFDICYITTQLIYDEYPTSENYQSIHNFIKTVYETENIANHTFDGKLGYLLLVGDSRFSNNNICIPSKDQYKDDFYSQLSYSNNEPDIYPDIMIGRISVDEDNNYNQLQNYYEKLSNYHPTEMTNKNTLMIIGNDEGYHAQEIALSRFSQFTSSYIIERRLLLASSYPQDLFIPVWDFVQQGYNNESINDAITDNTIYTNYIGHGAVESWYYNENEIDRDFFFNELDNYKVTNIYSMSCNTGNFQSQTIEDCMAERFIGNSPTKGALSFIASATYTYFGAASSINKKYNESIFVNYSYVLGESHMISKISHPYDFACFNFLGDPALNIFNENSTLSLPDLVLRKCDIDVNENLIRNRENQISFSIRNQSNNQCLDDFDIGFYYRKLGENTWNLIEQIINNENIDVYEEKFFTYNWCPDLDGHYEIKIEADDSNMVSEINEDNNISKILRTISSVNANFPLQTLNESSDSPTVFTNLNNGQELIKFGTSLYNFSGIMQTNFGSNSEKSIVCDLDNDNNLEILFINSDNRLYCYRIDDPDNTIFEYNLDDNWISSDIVIFDINNDSIDEIILSQINKESVANTTYQIEILDINGQQINLLNDFNNFSLPYEGLQELSDYSCFN